MKVGPGRKSLAFAALYLIVVTAAATARKVSPLILVLYVVASVITFAVYRRDKQAAKNGGQRTSESTLHLLSLLGGWPGALVAQRMSRHKTKKESFQSAFWATVIMNCGAFALVLLGADHKISDIIKLI
ncbi:MAG: DUF1294 domain-containing protein [Steroidobacteraceae bacterium]